MNPFNKKICSITVTFNVDPVFLLQQIECLKTQVNHICIVDNGSINQQLIKTLNELKKTNNITVILNSQNLGIAAGLNKGVQYALNKSYDFVLTLDHDSLPENNMVNYELAETYVKVGELEKARTHYSKSIEQSAYGYRGYLNKLRAKEKLLKLSK